MATFSLSPKALNRLGKIQKQLRKIPNALREIRDALRKLPDKGLPNRSVQRSDNRPPAAVNDSAATHSGLVATTPGIEAGNGNNEVDLGLPLMGERSSPNYPSAASSGHVVTTRRIETGDGDGSIPDNEYASTLRQQYGELRQIVAERPISPHDVSESTAGDTASRLSQALTAVTDNQPHVLPEISSRIAASNDEDDLINSVPPAQYASVLQQQYRALRPRVQSQSDNTNTR
jgi:hypothetical protein